MRVERGPRSVGEIAIEREQIEGVAGGEQTEELVLGHDLAVGAEPRRPGYRMAMPRCRPGRQLVHVDVADEDLVGCVGARGIPVAQVWSQKFDRPVDLAQDTQRLGAETHEARRMREHQRDRADDRHALRRYVSHARHHTLWPARSARYRAGVSPKADLNARVKCA